jgi:hypothetical protein
MLNNNNDTTYYGSNYLSLISEKQQQLFSHISVDVYVALILEEIEKLYHDLTTKLTNSIISATTVIRASLSPPLNRKDDRL